MNTKSKIAVFSAKAYDRKYFSATTEGRAISFDYFDVALDEKTAKLAGGYDVVCVFVNDELDSAVVKQLAQLGIKLIALRCAGFNNVDLVACDTHDIRVVRVPEYSPHSVAEHTFGLILTLNRKIHKAFNRVREGNFALDGLMGFDLFGKTIGVIGCGKIGAQVAKISKGFGMDVFLVDPCPNPELEDYGDYTDLEAALEESDILTLHCPLNEQTEYLIDSESLDQMKIGSMLINTSRGGLVDTAEVIRRLKWGQLGSLAIDVYEEEAEMFFQDRSDSVLKDDVFARLLTFSNVLITGHQAFFTHEALTQIAETTAESVLSFAKCQTLENEVKAELVAS
jgi:D-lactate dehydrogenase